MKVKKIYILKGKKEYIITFISIYEYDALIDLSLMNEDTFTGDILEFESVIDRIDKIIDQNQKDNISIVLWQLNTTLINKDL